MARSHRRRHPGPGTAATAGHSIECNGRKPVGEVHRIDEAQRSRRLARDARRSVPRVRDGTRGERLRGLLPRPRAPRPRPGSRWAARRRLAGADAGRHRQRGLERLPRPGVAPAPPSSSAPTHPSTSPSRPGRRPRYTSSIPMAGRVPVGPRRFRVTRPGRTAGVVTAAAVSPWRTTMASWRGATTTSRRRSNSGRADRVHFLVSRRRIRPALEGRREAASGPLLDSVGGPPTSARPARCGATMTPHPTWLAVSACISRHRRLRRATVASRSSRTSIRPPTRSLFLGRNGRPIGGTPIDLPGDIETQCLFGDTLCAGIVFPALRTTGPCTSRSTRRRPSTPTPTTR